MKEENNIEELTKENTSEHEESSFNDVQSTEETMNQESKSSSKENKIQMNKIISVAKNKTGQFTKIIKNKAAEITDPEKPLSKSVEHMKQKSADTIAKVRTDMQEKKAIKDEIKPEKIILKPGEVKKYKLFFVSDMEEEAKYLHEMSLQGMHFMKKAGMQYVFTTGDSKNYYYHLGYYEKDKRDGNRYNQNYNEAGWENIYHEKGEFDGVWNYFRIEIDENEPIPHIFSDRISRIALYNRLLSSWRTLLAMMVVCLICMGSFLFFLNSKTRINPIFLIICITLSIIILIIFAVYSKIYLKINKKLIELNK